MKRKKHLASCSHFACLPTFVQAQGLKGIFPDIKEMLQEHNVLLAAHGPYTAEGVHECLDVPVRCISQNFKTFDGIVLALEHSFEARDIKGIKLG